MVDLPPPLEDCSKQVKYLQGKLEPKPSAKPVTFHAEVHPPRLVQVPLVRESTPLLRKGFFSITGSKTKKTDIIEVIAKVSKSDPLRIPEVQAAMGGSMQNLLSDKSWMTPDLSQKILSDPLLSKSLTEPRFQDALALLQKDPKQAKAKYENDEQVTAMLTKFMSLFGSHFESLGSKQPQFSDLQTMLKEDPDLARVVEYMRGGGQLDPRRLPPQLLTKVKHLIDKGLLKIHT
jgi:hypothetical protein